MQQNNINMNSTNCQEVRNNDIRNTIKNKVKDAMFINGLMTVK